MPSNGPHSFLHMVEPSKGRSPNVSMPSNGQHSFLHLSWRDITEVILMCQCPQTGNTHFYGKDKNDYVADSTCQCPQTGHTHFYIEEIAGTVKPYRVSMPSNGQHSFLPHQLRQAEGSCRVSMPSNGPHSFLPIIIMCEERESFVCQCPPTGHTHFYFEGAR